ncbi:hypothetical protein HMI54_008599, partial [Coelomomyces lativittatus]
MQVTSLPQVPPRSSFSGNLNGISMQNPSELLEKLGTLFENLNQKLDKIEKNLKSIEQKGNNPS